MGKSGGVSREGTASEQEEATRSGLEAEEKCTGLRPEPKPPGASYPGAGSVDRKLLGECRFSGGVTVLLWQC